MTAQDGRAERAPGYESHALADAFPAMIPSEMSTLVDDIQRNGLIDPIVLDADGRVLDGRHRLEACRRAKVEPRFRAYEGDDPAAFVLSKNLARRHLSASQRAMVAARIAELPRGRPGRSAFMPVSQPEAASALHVSERSVRKARRVIREAPELADQVDRGEITVGAAERSVHDQVTGANKPGRPAEPAADPAYVVKGLALVSRVPPSTMTYLEARYDQIDVTEIDELVALLDQSIAGLSDVRAQLAAKRDSSPDATTEVGTWRM